MPESNPTGEQQSQSVVPDSSVTPAEPVIGTPAPLAQQTPSATTPPDNSSAYTDNPSDAGREQVANDATTEPDSSNFREEADGASPEEQAISQEALTWTASEFIAHHKTPGWYGKLALAAVAGAGVVYLFTRDIISSGVVIFAAILFGISAARQPRELEYALDGNGVQIGPKYYSLATFRSFSVVPEGAFSSVIFMPLKRFAPITTIYFAPENEPRIVNLLSATLPFEDYKHDPLERLMRRIRF